MTGRAVRIDVDEMPATWKGKRYGIRGEYRPGRGTAPIVTGDDCPTIGAALASAGEAIRTAALAPVTLIGCGDGSAFLVVGGRVASVDPERGGGGVTLTDEAGALDYARGWAERERGGVRWEVIGR